MRMFAFLFSSVFLFAATSNAQQGFQFGVTDSPFKIGPFKVKSCQILIPNLGSSHKSVEETLVKKGYQPLMNERLFDGSISATGGVLGSGTKTLGRFNHRDLNLMGLAYLDAKIDVGPAASQSKLMLKVVGEDGMESLYDSERYIFVPSKNQGNQFDANDLPDCKNTNVK